MRRPPASTHQPAAATTIRLSLPGLDLQRILGPTWGKFRKQEQQRVAVGPEKRR